MYAAVMYFNFLESKGLCCQSKDVRGSVSKYFELGGWIQVEKWYYFVVSQAVPGVMQQKAPVMAYFFADGLKKLKYHKDPRLVVDS